ncbi:MAG: winged helix-turn-helix transcriptional regulator [Anaerolineales bacterium]
MLKQILREIADGYGRSKSSLARRLDISEGLLSQMMNDLARRGYLAPLAPESMGTTGTTEKAGACQGCKLSAACSSCAINKQPLLAGWVLTAKGRRAAEG